MKSLKELAADVRGHSGSGTGWVPVSVVFPLLNAIENSEELAGGTKWLSSTKGPAHASSTWLENYGENSKNKGTILFFPNPQPSLIELAKEAASVLREYGSLMRANELEAAAIAAEEAKDV